jgi:hypothetical protein
MSDVIQQENQKHPKRIFKIILKFFFYSILFFILIILTGITVILLNENKIKSRAIEELNRYLNTPVFIQPENIDITFLRTFPNTTLRLSEVSVMGSHPKFKDTLIHAQMLEFHFSIWKLLENNISIHKIFAKNLKLNPILHKDGKENWIFLKSKDDGKEASKPSDTEIDLEEITLQNVTINYRDKKNDADINFSIDEIASGIGLHKESIKIKLKADGLLHSLKISEKEYIKEKKFKTKTDIEKTNSNYSLDELTLTLSDMKLNMSGFIVLDSLFKKADIRFEGDDIRPESILSILKYNDNQLPKTNDPLDIKGRYTFENKQHALSADFEGKDLEITHEEWKTRLSHVQLKGNLEIGRPSESHLTIEYIKGNWNDKPFDARLHLSDFEKLNADFSFNGQIPVPLLLSLSGKDSLFSCTGELYGSIKLQCSEQQFRKKEILPDTRLELMLLPKMLSLTHKPSNKSAIIDSGRISTDNQRVLVENLSLKMGENDFLIRGEWKKFPGYIFGNEPLEIAGNLFVKKWDVKNWMEELMAWNQLNENTPQTSGNSSPNHKTNKGFRLNLALQADALIFSDFKAQQVFMLLDWQDDQVFAEDIRMNLFGGNVTAAIRMDMKNEKYHFISEGNFSDIGLKDAFQGFNNFGQQTLTDKNLDGILHGNYFFKGTWDENFNCMMNSVLSQAQYTICRGRLKNFEPLKGLSKFISVDELNDIWFDDINGSLSIEKLKIFFPKTQIKNSALNLQISGEHGFDNVLNYHLTVSLPELLSKKSKQKDEFLPDEQNRRKLFVRIYGTMDNLKYSVDKQGIKEKIKEDFALQKTEMKKIFQEEFKGKKDSTMNKSKAKFELEDEKPNSKMQENKNPFNKKKKADEDDDY